MEGKNLPDEAALAAVERLHDDPDERLDRLRDRRASDGEVTAQARVFKALAHEDRLRLLAALREGECCACELQVVLDAPQSTVGTHLRKLKDAGLVRSRRRGRWSYYRLADGGALDVLDIAAAVGEGSA